MASITTKFLEFSCLCLVSWITVTNSVSHETSLMWTEKGDNSLVRIVGIPGNPFEWLTTGNISLIGQGMPANMQARVLSSRIALAFRYSTQNVFFSDRGFKEIMRTKLRIMNSRTYSYNVTLNRVYSGISKEVNGLAVDWLSGSLYWTDALYNWISICDSQRFDIYRHLITTGMDKPIGITVDPVEGVMFWSDWGSQPKIEKASLDGSNRVVLVKSNLHRPLGMSIDIDNKLLYWVDAWSDSIERVDLNGGHRHSIVMHSSAVNSHVAPWGIAIYNHTAFVTDQHHRTIHVIDINREKRIARLELRNMPYDVMMYDESLQKITPTQCKTLQCDHICVSMGGEKARCMCKQGYALKGGSSICQPDGTMHQPLWIYSIGRAICSTRINIADKVVGSSLQENSDCFLPGLKNVRALGYYGNDDLLFFSDTDEMTITRVRLFNVHENHKKIPISANVASVKGIAVDWMSENLYWTDEDLGIIVVSKVDGKYPHILMENAGQPRGIDLNPNTGDMFWSDGYSKSVMKAKMDGSEKRVLVDNLNQPEGVTVDIKDNRLFWCERDGIRTRHLDGSDPKNLYVPQTQSNAQFRSAAVFEDFYGFTDASNKLFFGNKETGSLQVGAEHTDASVTGHIIAYSSTNQPIVQVHNGTWPCDVENGGCHHLCIPIGKEKRVCKCAIGFLLENDGTRCYSHATKSHFLLFADPFHRQLYQLNLKEDNPSPQGIHLPPNIEFPEFFDMDDESSTLFYANKVDRTIVALDMMTWEDKIIKKFEHDVVFEGLAFSRKTGEVIYADFSIVGRRVEAIKVDGGSTRVISAGIYPTALAVDESDGMVYWSQVQNLPEEGEKTYLYRAQTTEPANKKVIWQSDNRVQYITIDKYKNRLFWCTFYSVYESNKEGNDLKELIKDNSAQFSALAVSPAGIHISHENKRTLYKLVETRTGYQTQVVTSPLFSRITDVKEFYDIENFSPIVDFPRVGASTGSKTNNILLVVVVGAVIAILLLVLITAIILWRLKRKPRIAKDNYDTQAHDNPTYATHQTVTGGGVGKDEEDPYDTLPGAEGDLPDVLNTKKELPDDKVGGSPDPYKDMTDKQNLVVPAEVVLDVDDAKALGVKYKK